MGLLLKNLGLNVGYYALTVVAGPAGVLALERSVSGEPPPNFWLRVAGGAVILVSVVVQVSCIITLQRGGAGTPSPLIPPVQLVTQGLYAWVRNPLNLGEVALLLGLAVWFASWGLVCYALAAWLCFHWFVVAYEEPRHRQRFGAGYNGYAARVRRWLPQQPATLRLPPN